MKFTFLGYKIDTAQLVVILTALFQTILDPTNAFILDATGISGDWINKIKLLGLFYVAFKGRIVSASTDVQSSTRKVGAPRPTK